MLQTTFFQKCTPSVSRAFGRFFSPIFFTLLFVQSIFGQNIPDANFANAIRQVCPTCIDANNDLTAAAANLTELRVTDKGISSLSGIEGFSSLQALSCSNNHLTSLPTLPSSLQVLTCSKNDLTSLPTLPSSLQILICERNFLTSLPTLPSSLEQLFCDSNRLTSLPTLPSNLQQLFCEHNRLTSLPTLPSSLQVLYCPINRLTNLPTLPSGLRYLYCFNNPINCLPTLPSLVILFLDADKILCLPNQISGTVYNYNFSVITLPTCSSPPSIVTHPSVPSLLCSTGSLTLTAKASSGGNTTVHWQRNGVDIPNTSTAYTSDADATYTFTTTQNDNGASYRAVFTSACVAEAATNAATLVLDNIPPQITCPPPLSTNTDLGVCGAVVAYPTPTATDNCSATVARTSGLASSVAFPVGTSSVVFTATDASNNTSTCSFTVTVIDNENPVIVFPCPTPLSKNTDLGICGAVVTFATPTAADNCSPTVARTSGLASGATFPVGTSTVVFTASDPSGNTESCSFSVTVTDNQKPNITAPAAVSVCSGNNVALGTPITSDNCGVLSVSNNAPSVFLIGTTTVLWTVKDVNNNTQTASQTVTVTPQMQNTCKVIYLGYGDNCKTLTPASGANYLWNTGATTNSLSVCPTTTTNYTVTVTNPTTCWMIETFRVEVIDVRCGNKNDKVQVCHNGNVLCISSNAVSAHLSHGDKLGACSLPIPCSSGSSNSLIINTNTGSNFNNAQDSKEIHLYPNPAAKEAWLDLKMYEDLTVSIAIFDIAGKTIFQDKIEKASAAPYRLDLENLQMGLYFVKIQAQGDKITTHKLQVVR